MAPSREPASLEPVFAALRAHYLRHADAMVLLKDDPAHYALGTQTVREKDGYRIWFGGVDLCKAYVSAHLMAVYAYPELLVGIGDPLRARLHGKACFNFRVRDAELIEPFGALVDASVARCRAAGWL